MPHHHRARSTSALRAASFRLEALESRQMLNADFRIVPTTAAPMAVAAEVATAHHARPHKPHGQGTGGQAHPGVHPLATPAAAPYTPAQIRHAYGVDQVSQTGAGQTIAIVDAYDDPTIASDLAKFSQAFGLPAANLVKAVPSTGTPAFNAGWAGEIALDVEWAHAIAPGAKILLVEAKSSSMTDLLSAVDYAVAQGAKQVSMSWGGGEFAGQSYYDTHFKHPGVTFLSAAGDSGAAAEFPSSSAYVTAVGGTSLQLDSAGNRIAETAWSGSGGALSTVTARPSYQKGFNSSSYLGVPSVSYNSDPNTGYYVYDTSSGGSWYQVGGTSAGAPQWAALVALANQGRAAAKKASLGTGTTFGTNEVLYKLAASPTTGAYSNARGDYLDIVSGSNGNPAKVGYDLVTGLGSPVANKLSPDLISA